MKSIHLLPIYKYLCCKRLACFHKYTKKGTNRPLLVSALSEKFPSSWPWTQACPTGEDFPQFLLLCNVFMWYFKRFVFSSLEAVAQCYNVTPQRKLTFHMSQTFLPSVILIIVAGISFFVPSDQVNQCEPRVHILDYCYSIVFDPSDSWPACSMRDNSSHIHFHVQHCSKPHSSGSSSYESEMSGRFISFEGFLHESS